MGFFVTLIFELLTHFANHFTGYFFPPFSSSFFFALQGIEDETFLLKEKGRKKMEKRIPNTVNGYTEKEKVLGRKGKKEGKFKERNEIPSEMKCFPGKMTSQSSISSIS